MCEFQIDIEPAYLAISRLDRLLKAVDLQDIYNNINDI